jgi:hypothetical protein
MNAPVRKSTITRAIAAGEGHGYGDAVRPPQDANENVPLAVKTQTHVSGETWLERETSPYRVTSAATICGDDPRNAARAVATARSKLRRLAGGKTAGAVVGAGDGDAVDEGAGEVLLSVDDEEARGVATSACGWPTTWVPTRKDPAATTSHESTIHPDREKGRPEGSLTRATGVEYPSSGWISSSDLMSAAA